MKYDTLQQLLEKYHEGTLTDEEREQLDSMTHRDEVFASAERQARSIVRTRIMRTAACIASLLVVGGAVLWTQMPRQQDTMIARQEPIVVAPQVNSEPVLTQPEPLQTVAAKPVAKPKPRPRVAKIQHTEIVDEQVIVVCNNKCEADSVINEIRNFLSV